MERFKKFWFSIDEKIRFILIGGFNAFVSFSIFVVLIHFLADHGVVETRKIYSCLKENITVLNNISFMQFIRQFSLLFAWIFSSFVSFTTQRILVFRARGQMNIIKQYIRCLYTWMVGYIVNVIVLEILASLFLKYNILPPIIELDISQFFALGISSIGTFILFKYFAFKKKKV